MRKPGAGGGGRKSTRPVHAGVRGKTVRTPAEKRRTKRQAPKDSRYRGSR